MQGETSAWNWSRRRHREGGAPATVRLDYALYTGDEEVATIPGQWQVRTELILLTNNTLIWCARCVVFLTSPVKTQERGEEKEQCSLESSQPSPARPCDRNCTKMEVYEKKSSKL